MRLDVTTRLLEKLLVMLFQDVVDYVDGFVGVLQGNAVATLAAALLVEAGALA